MGCLRVIFCIIFPPLAVLDRGCGSLVLVCLLTLCGWVPGVIAAIILCQQPVSNQQSPTKSLGQSTNPIVLILVACFAALVFFSVFGSVIEQFLSTSSSPVAPPAKVVAPSPQPETNAKTNVAPAPSQPATNAAPATVATDNPEAAAYRVKATAGDAEAAQQLGYLYLTGQGVTKDLTEALKWIQIAANQGNAKSQYNLGILYYNGQGVTQDYKQALSWYQKAADQGVAEAQFCMGHMYENGQGVTQDVPTAVEWYKKAAAQGQSNAQAALKRLNVQN